MFQSTLSFVPTVPNPVIEMAKFVSKEGLLSVLGIGFSERSLQ